MRGSPLGELHLHFYFFSLAEKLVLVKSRRSVIITCYNDKRSALCHSLKPLDKSAFQIMLFLI